MPGDSAEVIHERENIDGKTSALLATPPVPFTDAQIFYDGASRPLLAGVAGLTLERDYITNDTKSPPTSPNTVAYPTAPSGADEAFDAVDGPAPG